MDVPEIIPVQWTEEVAGFVDTRPVMRQGFRLGELVDMILATTGKNHARVAEILRSGTCVYNTYRYWWQGFTVEGEALAAVLAEFPDPQPGRPFRAQACTWLLLVSGDEPIPHTQRVERAEASRRRWFRRESFWDFLLELAERKLPRYREYSYYHRGDLYDCRLEPRGLGLVEFQAAHLARRRLRQRLLRAVWRRMELFCPRTS